MRTPLLTGAALAVALLATTGCEKQDPAGMPDGVKTPAAKTGAPAPAPVQQAKVEGAAMAPGSQPGAALPPGHPPTGGMPPGHPPAGNMPPGHPPTGALPPGHPPAGNMPAGHPPTGMPAPGEAVGAGGTLSGTIALDPSMTDKVKAGSVLFIIVRRDEGEGQKGMLLAAKKIPVTGTGMFPLKYTVGPADVMMQGTQLAGGVRVEARVDQDGDAISKAPGDVVGVLARGVKVGDEGVDFALDSNL